MTTGTMPFPEHIERIFESYRVPADTKAALYDLYVSLGDEALEVFGDIAESNETDNVFTRTFTVQGPNLAFVIDDRSRIDDRQIADLRFGANDRLGGNHYVSSQDRRGGNSCDSGRWD